MVTFITGKRTPVLRRIPFQVRSTACPSLTRSDSYGDHRARTLIMNVRLTRPSVPNISRNLISHTIPRDHEVYDINSSYSPCGGLVPPLRRPDERLPVPSDAGSVSPSGKKTRQALILRLRDIDSLTRTVPFSSHITRQSLFSQAPTLPLKIKTSGSRSLSNPP